MNPFEMVIAIVAIVTVGGIIRARIGGRSGHPGIDFRERNDMAAAENEMLRQDINRLKERIAVLERVITDTNTSSTLDREIEKLRNTDR